MLDMPSLFSKPERDAFLAKGGYVEWVRVMVILIASTFVVIRSQDWTERGPSLAVVILAALWLAQIVHHRLAAVRSGKSGGDRNGL